jgi:hypothetical protein
VAKRQSHREVETQSHGSACSQAAKVFPAVAFSLGSVCKIETCHSERLEGATPSRRFGAGENLGLLPEIAFENEILTALACSAHLPWRAVPGSVVASLLTPLRGVT